MSTDGTRVPFQLGFREFYRIVVPGFVFLALLILTFPELNLIDAFTKVALGFGMGLAIYALGISKIGVSRIVPRHRGFFHSQIGRLTEELKLSCGLPSSYGLRREESKAAYSYFLERYATRPLAERIHYFTSFYYMFSDVSFVLFLFAILKLVVYFWHANTPLVAVPKVTSLYTVTIVQPAAGNLTFVEYLMALEIPSYAVISLPIEVLILAVAVFATRTSARKSLDSIINEQIVLVREEFPDHARILLSASALYKTEKSKDMRMSVDEIMISVMKGMAFSMMKELALDPSVEFSVDSIRIVERKEPATGDVLAIFQIRVRTNNRFAVVGDPGGYKGIYKENIEARLTSFVKQFNPAYRVVLDVIGKELDKYKLLDLKTALELSIIRKESPIHRLCEELGIPHILLRGRFILGPNPFLLRVVRNLLQKGEYGSLLDIFAGTGAISKVALMHGINRVLAVDNKTADVLSKLLADGRSNIVVLGEDVYSDTFKKILAGGEGYDLIVVDPEYESAVNFLSQLGTVLIKKCKLLIMCHGFSEDDAWNSEVRSFLQSIGFQVQEADSDGCAISVCRPQLST